MQNDTLKPMQNQTVYKGGLQPEIQAYSIWKVPPVSAMFSLLMSGFQNL